MADQQDLWLIIPRPLRELPADLVATVVLTLLTLVSVFVPGINETPLRVVFGLGFVLFLPGYAFIAALFPEAGTSEPPEAEPEPTAKSDTGEATAKPDSQPAPVPGTEAADITANQTAPADGSTPATSTRAGIDGIERVALSFGLSIAIVPLLGLVLNFTPWGIRLLPVVIAVAGFTLGCVAIAAQRRWAVPPENRFRVPFRAWITAGKQELFEPADRTDAALNIVLGLSVLLAVASVGYAVAVPPQGEQFSEFYLLTETPDGELVADGYPDTMTLNETAELVVGIGNNEYEPTTYTVVVQLQDVEIEGNQSTVQTRTELDRFRTSLGHNETHHERHQLRPTRTGENLRVQYLLYQGDAPATPTADTAYRELHLWVDVTRG